MICHGLNIVVQEERINIFNGLLYIRSTDTIKRAWIARIGEPTCPKNELNPLSKESRSRSLNLNQSPAIPVDRTRGWYIMIN